MVATPKHQQHQPTKVQREDGGGGGGLCIMGMSAEHRPQSREVQLAHNDNSSDSPHSEGSHHGGYSEYGQSDSEWGRASDDEDDTPTGAVLTPI